MDDAARKAFGLPEQDYVSGATEIDLTYVGRSDGSSKITVEGDLENTVLEVSELDWNKPSGVAGHASIVATLAKEGLWQVERFDVATADLKTSGSLELEPDPLSLRLLQLDDFEIGGTDIRGTLAFDVSAGYRIRIEGQRFNAAPLVDYLEARNAESDDRGSADETPVQKNQAAIDLEARIGRLELAETSALNDLSVSASFDGEKLQELHVEARMDPKAVVHPEANADARTEADSGVDTKFTLSHAPDEDGHRLSIETSNLGTLIEGLHLSTAINGGNAQVTARRASPDAPWIGSYHATNFTLLEAPSLAKILELGSIKGITSELSSEGLWFETIDVGLTLHDRQLKIENGKVLGHGFAITVEGFVDFGNQEIDLQGAVTPMETVQRVIGHIPLVGRLLTGWHREGIIAFLYTVKGNLTQPVYDVKKFSALTPGITREIYKLAPDGKPTDGSKTGKKQAAKDLQ